MIASELPCPIKTRQSYSVYVVLRLAFCARANERTPLLREMKSSHSIWIKRENIIWRVFKLKNQVFRKTLIIELQIKNW